MEEEQPYIMRDPYDLYLGRATEAENFEVCSAQLYCGSVNRPLLYAMLTLLRGVIYETDELEEYIMLMKTLCLANGVAWRELCLARKGNLFIVAVSWDTAIIDDDTHGCREVRSSFLYLGGFTKGRKVLETGMVRAEVDEQGAMLVVTTTAYHGPFVWNGMSVLAGVYRCAIGELHNSIVIDDGFSTAIDYRTTVGVDRDLCEICFGMDGSNHVCGMHRTGIFFEPEREWTYDVQPLPIDDIVDDEQIRYRHAIWKFTGHGYYCGFGYERRCPLFTDDESDQDEEVDAYMRFMMHDDDELIVGGRWE
jgi:hypothetical protein